MQQQEEKRKFRRIYIESWNEIDCLRNWILLRSMCWELSNYIGKKDYNTRIGIELNGEL